MPGVADNRSMGSIEVTANHLLQQFEARVDGVPAAVAVYRREPGLIELWHVEVEPEFEGKGVGSELVRQVLDVIGDDAAEPLRVIPSCPFVAGWINRHPEYQRLLQPRG